MGKLITDWKNKNIEILTKMYPKLNVKDTHIILDAVIEENFKNPKAIIHNNYLDDYNVRTDLATLYDWCEVKKPICAGNGVFFYNQDKIDSPIGELIDARISDRKKYQKIRDTFEPGSYEYIHYDMLQLEAKIKINSIYGAFGAATFQLFNLYTASSTTGTAQSLISTTATCFEAFLTNSVKFKNLDQCFTFISNLIEEEYKLPLDGITTITSVEVVYRRIRATFDKWDPEYEKPIKKYLSTLDNYQLTKVYYKNNLYTFMECPLMHGLLIKAYNSTESFRDPNKPDDNIKPILEEIWKYVEEFVFYNYFFVERIARLKKDKRHCITLIDTDSDVAHIRPWVKYTRENIWTECDSAMTQTDMRFASVNIIAFLLTKVVVAILHHYCDNANVLPKYHHRINMKNEFYFTKILLADVKKRYIASIRLKEGRELYPEKIEIKGHDFKKSGVTIETSKTMEGIIYRNILDENVETANVPGILKDISNFDKEIRRSLSDGEKTYLLKLKAKTPEMYDSDPFRHRQVVSVYNWNSLYPDIEIQHSSIIHAVLTKDITPQAIEPLKTKYPVEYERMHKFIFTHRDKKISGGITCIAIPTNVNKIPDFIRNFIDYDYIVGRNLNTFRPILTALGLPYIKGSDITSISGGKKKTEFFSNIIDI